MSSEPRDLLRVDVVLNSEKTSPHCPHGPTLLFEKFFADKTAVKRYYACSACRDRKNCNFFQWEDEKVSVQRQRARENFNKSSLPVHRHKHYFHRLKLFKKLVEKDRKFCLSCNELLLPAEWTNHTEHELMENITNEQLTTPTQLMKPLENNKSNAQYLFSSKAANFIVETLHILEGKNILCVGCPRVHETVQTLKKKKKYDIDSLLLDIDHRFMQFYSTQHFCHYNMFNHHFFNGDLGKASYQEFMGRDEVYVVTDPPFGGLVEVLAATIKTMTTDWTNSHTERVGKVLPILWIFPYFMEARMVDCLPEVAMLDYKVEYDNHPLYKQKSNSQKRGSPVRIFANISPELVSLPKEDGYWFCKICRTYRSAENLHCAKCETCPSKDGSTYKHCEECGRCVKPSRTHCDQCKQCVMIDHKCGQILPAMGCHVCGSLDHKRRQCPERHGTNGGKRKLEGTSITQASNKRKRKRNR